jgi:uncharacterized protein (TIGR04255 family)
MALSLPDPYTSQLPRSPLELVICQIRFDKRLRVGEAQLALAFHEELGGSSGPYPQLSDIEGQEFVMSAGVGIEPQTQPRSFTGWRLTSAEGDWIITLMPDHVSLETTSYTSWDEDFQPRIAALITATANCVEPSIEQRLGLRYVDRIRELQLTSIEAWRDYIVPELLGPIVHPHFGPATIAAAQQLLFGIDEETRAGVRHGPVSDSGDGYVDYLLDYDLFRQGGRSFDVNGLIAAAHEFNRSALQLFQASVTDKLLEFFRRP